MDKRKHKNPHKNRKVLADSSQLYIYGSHAVRAAVENPQRHIKNLYLTENAGRELAETLARRDIAPEIRKAQQLGSLLPPDAVHQGMVLETQPLPEPDLADLATSGKLLVLLDQVSDPRNVGAILRAAAVFGAGGVVLSRRNSPPPFGALAKTASGALEVVPLLAVTNLARTLKTLHTTGYMSVGLDERGDTLIGDVPKDRPLAVVMGAEGSGLRRLTRETCDMLARLPSADDAGLATLNVASATAVTLYALRH
ncbi:MAG TPA: 23S rRNA (guanosine(2251)-2'-O)-methyltransferase RlmB [Rhodobiaceae bacterium]|nr:23S rRNA (guanosine(2251)-2'-O)-methyltransferase RlmB [Rhodobiaceae bacterium]